MGTEFEGVVGLSLDSAGRTTVASLWLDPGRGLGTGDDSRLTRELVVGVMSLTLAVKLGAATLLRFETIELVRLNPWGSWALHLLETLSDLLIIAL